MRVVEQQSLLLAPRRLLDAFNGSGAELLLDTAAWGIWGRDLAVCRADGQSAVITFEQVIIATGSFERPVAFPGWTLPGVMSLDSALRMVEQGVAPGNRLLLAGYGAYLADAHAELAQHGVAAVEILDAAVSRGRLPIRAEGGERLERVVSARVDADWHARGGTERTHEVDMLVLAFGRLPEDRLARLCGCDVSGSLYIDPRTVRDEWMRTTMRGVLVAGDAGGIVGAEASVAQGRLAGLAAALDCGVLSVHEATRRARPVQRRRRHGADATALPKSGLLALAEPETVICRCEDVTAGQVTEHIFEGNLEPASVIAETRGGMGLCQGRNCASLIAATIARHAGIAIEGIPAITPRPPIVPVPLGVIAERPPVFAPVSELGAVR